MKKVLFCLQTMVCGGVETELLVLLNLLNREEYDITVRLFYVSDKEMLNKIPKDLNVDVLNVDRDYWLGGFKSLVANRIKRGKIIEAINLSVNTLKRHGSSTAFVSLDGFPNDESEYDIAICFHVHSGLVLRYVSEKIKARRKIAWIHNDFDTTGYNIEYYEKSLEHFDRFVAVSQKLQQEFISHCNAFADKSEVIYNISDCETILEKANTLNNLSDRYFKDNRTKLLTVGRLEKQKGIDLAIEACKRLADEGYDIAWYVVGDGSERAKYQEMIDRNGLAERFVLLGRRDNPFSYMNVCDYYIQPSRHEGYVLTVSESMVLNKTIVCTNFAGAKEQIEDGITGYIVKDMSAEALADKIGYLLKNKLHISCDLQSLVRQKNTRSLALINKLFE